MRRFGSLLMIVGAALALYQASVLHAHGYWPVWTISDLLAEFRLRFPVYPYRPITEAFYWLGSRETSFVSLSVGAFVFLLHPIARLFDNYHAARTVETLRREIADDKADAERRALETRGSDARRK